MKPLLLVAVVVLQISLSVGSKKVHVNLRNAVDPNTPITIDCASKDNDLGPHVLAFQQFYNFSFHFDVRPWQPTVFVCTIISNEPEPKILVAYAHPVTYPKCHHNCIWDLHKDQACLMVWEENRQECEGYLKVPPHALPQDLS